MKKLISLKNVSKFYYSKGMIASGFTKVSVDFDIGEMVAITGESGSGKSTLLNVISGLDSYEEGELYINGKETSHYTDTDFEDYRRKYISNIFQSFNLVNSYSVYQNIELVLLLNGYSKRKIKKRVLELIDTVGLTKFKNMKVSKLSGGQKQRVAIARALAKDTPIIIADEPTGNLDSKQASEIIELINNIRKDKLIIIVTHNYEQVEKYVTRKIKMHDGKIVEDIKIKDKDNDVSFEESKYKNIKMIERIRLGIRNSLNIFTKLALMTLVYLFVTCALTSLDAVFKSSEKDFKNSGTNFIFRNTSKNRIILKKKDNSSFTDEDYNKLNNIKNVKNTIKNDIFLDTYANLAHNGYYIGAKYDFISNYNGELTYGSKPERDDEVILRIGKYTYIGIDPKEAINMKFVLEDITQPTGEALEVTIAGIEVSNKDDEFNETIYISDELSNKMNEANNYKNSRVYVVFQGKRHESSSFGYYRIKPSNKVEPGKAIISDKYSDECKNHNCKNSIVYIEVESTFYKDNLSLTVSDQFNKNNMQKILNLKYSEINDRTIYINDLEYKRLFDKPSYQTSVFIDKEDNVDLVKEELSNLGYNFIAIKDTLILDQGLYIFRIIENVVMAIFIVILFFISYFIIKLILKSRNVYFSTIRMLGANKKVCKKLLSIELLSYVTISYIIYLIFLYYAYTKNWDINFIKNIKENLTVVNYLVIYFILVCMSLLSSIKFSKKLFKSTAITSIREEV